MPCDRHHVMGRETRHSTVKKHGRAQGRPVVEERKCAAREAHGDPNGHTLRKGSMGRQEAFFALLTMTEFLFPKEPSKPMKLHF